MASIDLTNSDDDGVVVPMPAPRRRQARGRQCGNNSKSPVKPPRDDVVDLTSDTPPERRACSRGAAMGKIAIDFDGDEGPAGGGCASSYTPSKRRCRMKEEAEAGRANITAGRGVQSNGSSGGSSSSARHRAKDEASDGDPSRSVSCPACSVEMKAEQRIFLACGHWACADCLTKVPLAPCPGSHHLQLPGIMRRHRALQQSDACAKQHRRCCCPRESMVFGAAVTVCAVGLPAVSVRVLSGAFSWRAACAGRRRMPHMPLSHFTVGHAAVSDRRAGALEDSR